MQLNGFPKHARKIDKNWLFNNLSIYKINKLYDGKCFVRFFIHSLSCIRKLTRSLRSLVRFLIRLNSWIKIVRAHFPWSNLYMTARGATTRYYAYLVDILNDQQRNVPRAAKSAIKRFIRWNLYPHVLKVGLPSPASTLIPHFLPSICF